MTASYCCGYPVTRTNLPKSCSRPARNACSSLTCKCLATTFAQMPVANECAQNALKLNEPCVLGGKLPVTAAAVTSVRTLWNPNTEIACEMVCTLCDTP